MDRPFLLQGNTIQIYRYQLNYTDAEGNKQTHYAIDLPNIEAEQDRLERDGAFTVSELYTTDFEWLDGLDIGECNMEKAVEIWKAGEAAYIAALNAPTEAEYLLDLDFRMSKLELGL